jgi:hypothetical protein
MTWTTSILYVDAGGGQTIHKVRSSAGIGPIFPAIFACSNADYVRCWEGPDTINPSPAPGVADYLPVNPAAVLYFACSDGTVAVLRIPSPSTSIMLADLQTVDPANGSIVSLVAACIGALASESGSLATAYLAGHLEATPRR